MELLVVKSNKAMIAKVTFNLNFECFKTLP